MYVHASDIISDVGALVAGPSVCSISVGIENNFVPL
jgi:hypothetical protein